MDKEKNKFTNQNEIKEWILKHQILEKLKKDSKIFDKNNIELGWEESLEFLEEEKDILSKEEIDWLEAE